MHEHDIMKLQVEIDYSGNIEHSRNNRFSLMTHTVEYYSYYFIYVYSLTFAPRKKI